MPAQRRIVLASVGAAILLTAVASVGAEDDAQTDPASVDNVTLALSRLAIETKADEIPDQAYEAAEAAVLDTAAEEVIGKKLEMTDARLRELLDPARFIKVTDSKGGVAPEEVARMSTGPSVFQLSCTDGAKRRLVA